MTRSGPTGSDPATLAGSADAEQLQRVLLALPLLADVCRADQLLYTTGANGPTAVAHAAPHPVPSLYPQSQVGRRLDSRSQSPVPRVLNEGRERHTVRGVLIFGSPTFQEATPVHDPDGAVLAAVSSNANLLEHDRFQRQDELFRRVVASVRARALAGRLDGADKLGRLTEHDGVMIVDVEGIVRYVNSVAEHQYRRVGYVDSLVGEQISLLDTNEYICFRSIELGTCLEQRIQEQDQVWIKRVIPVDVPRKPRKFHLPPKQTRDPGALVFIQDITDEVRREQELRIKSAMVQEVHHRVKNNLQAVAALLTMEADQTGSDVARDSLRQTRGRVLSIAVVHEFLSRGDSADINILEASNRIAAEAAKVTNHDRQEIQFSVEGEPFSLPAQQATSCALAMNELIQNAVEHGFAGRPRGFVQIRFHETEASKVIDIADDGAGLPEGFDLEASPSLGLQITKTLVEGDLRGKLELLNGRGVTARISFPKELCSPITGA